jgi:polygalacturonase
MDPFNSARRELLRFGGIGLAAAATTAMPAADAAAQRSPNTSAAQGVFDIRTYGAVGDGKAVDSPSIDKAIEAAAAAGGGTVLFPPGTWLSFSIRLKSHAALYLSQRRNHPRSRLDIARRNHRLQRSTYDAAEPNTAWDAYQDYGHNHWHNSLIWGEGINDNLHHWPRPNLRQRPQLRRRPRPAGQRTSSPLTAAPPAVRPPRGNYTMFQAQQPGAGNKAIALKNCRNVLFRDFSILKGGHFGLLLTGVDNLTIDNLTIDTDRDGMDIDCCRNVRVSNCFVNSPWDDAICPKSSYALGNNRATENLTITNCYVAGSYQLGTMLDGTYKKFAPDVPRLARNGRIKCGTESNGGFKNITISNCVFEGCMGLSLESEDGALCEDIAISNITMRDVVSAPLFWRLGARLRGPKESTKVGTLQRIVISNLVSYYTAPHISSILSGIPDHPIRDVKISNVFIQHGGGGSADDAKIVMPECGQVSRPSMFGPTTPSQGFFLRHVTNLEMSHVEIQPATPDQRSSFYLEEVNRADFFAVTAPATPPAFALNKVTDLRILLSRAAKDTQLDSVDHKII